MYFARKSSPTARALCPPDGALLGRGGHALDALLARGYCANHWEERVIAHVYGCGSEHVVLAGAVCCLRYRRRATRRIRRGAPRADGRLIEEYVRGRRTGSQPTDLDALTARDAEVLGLNAHGLSNTEIAGHLIASQATVKTDVNRILSKLDLRDRVQAVVLGLRMRTR
jgi:DNA-binding NarL/FixJ family response regulator